MRRAAFFTALLLLTVSAVRAKPRSGLASSDFLAKPVGARYVGLGLAGLAVSGSPQAYLYNPAALQDMTTSGLAVDFQVANQSKLPTEAVLNASSLRGKKLTSIAFAGPQRAVFFRPLTSFDDFTITDTLDPANNFRRSQARVNQFGISAAQKAEKGYALGMNLSYLNAQRGIAVAETGQPPELQLGSGNGFALDFGFRDQRDYVVYGISLMNLPGLIYWDEFKTDQLPTVARAGFGFQPGPAFAFYTDYEKRYYPETKEDPDLWHFGLELAFARWLVLRGGSESSDFNDRNKTNYAWGFSVATARQHTLDVATRVVRVNQKSVNEYYVSLNWPLATEKK
ncbi:MAG: hypothetical protein IPO76_04885 [Elusimicrobia bacterium]|jgi:hypothetical protein|nr:hypothetical protein [Elusimicrobiota bacterium]MBK7208192.1 hypothetical protein [Elusimicrobiota bacterium]MBK7544956.1 hypothetical protein [Elusimicrobiota bacterium]MBK7574473.1 hypothetical protein [Elusimicrobiota bacterium]MBK7688163.1 hypothetical protein [Elusimicrobiota bacterium]